MKILNIFIITILVSVLFGTAQSQNVIFEPIKAQLNDDQIDDLEDSQRSLDKIDSYIKKATAIESKYSKYKSKKKKKYEKKTWEAKQYRVKAAEKRQKSYEKACGVYSEFIQAAKFYYEEDQSRANSLNDGAMEKLDGADSEMSRYKSSAKKKVFKKKIKYSKLSSAISSSTSLQNDALEEQFDALNLFIIQNDKMQKDERDNAAWRRATQQNTILAYQTYIKENPKGNHASDARKKIRELEEIARKKAEEEAKDKEISATGDYIFSIQIAATRIPISQFSLKRKYSDVSKIKKSKSGNFYKYKVGSFNTYEEAVQLRNTIRRNVPGAFIVVFDKNNQQIEVTNEMKPESMRD